MDSLPKSLNPNKLLKEQFVSNLTGSSFYKLWILLAVVPITIVMRQTIRSCRPIDSYATEKSLKKNDDVIPPPRSLMAYMATIVVDFMFVVLPMVLFFTVLSEWVIVGSFSLFFVLMLIAAEKRFVNPKLYLGEGINSFRSILTSFRVSTMSMTCFAILAVDFKVFPREFAKTETYGTGLMDLGVGSFVVANALVSRQARSISSTNWKTALKSTSPLILLGFGRIAFTTGVDYQVHVGEYGVHWNFFFTLAAVSLLTSIINVPPQYCGILGSVVLIGYQSWLNHGLNVYLLSEERGTDIISQNKEGIYSIFGYWGLYLLTVQCSHFIFFGNHAKSRSKDAAFIKAWLLGILFGLITIFLDAYVERVSRRMCNLAYVTWILSFNLQLLGGYMVPFYIPGTKLSTLEEAYDRNLLVSFVVANLLTGIINLSIETLFVSTIPAMSILILYSFTLSMIMGILDFYGVRAKFW